jgi:RHS repeat-associated protein
MNMFGFLGRLFRAVINLFRRLFGGTTIQGNSPPVVNFLFPNNDITGSEVLIEYVLTDNESNPSDVNVAYSVAGQPFQSATAAVGDPRHDGVSGLVTSSAGQTYRYVWNWTHDIQQDPIDDVIISVQASDAFNAGNTVQSVPLRLATVSAPVNSSPEVTILTPLTDVVADEVVIRYLLIDVESDPTEISVMFQIAGGPLRPATPKTQGPMHDGTTGLTTDPGGITHTFIWDWKVDIPQSPVTDVVVLMEPRDAYGIGLQNSSITFNLTAIRGAPLPPAIDITTPLGGAVVPPALIEFTLTDVLSSMFSVDVKYSLDNGTTFQGATAHANSGATTGLISSPQGEQHPFLWDALNNLATPNVQDVIIAITASNGQTTIGDTSVPFDISTNYPPGVDIWSPSGGHAPTPVRIEYILTDPDSNPIAVRAEYKLPGGNFLAAGKHPNSEDVVNLTSDPFGLGHHFLWDADVDLAGQTNTNDITFKITANDGIAEGSDISAHFDVGTPSPNLIFRFPKRGIHGSPVAILFEASEPLGNPLQGEVLYSDDQGHTFFAATAAPNLGSVDLNAITTTPSGVTHFFAWDAVADLPQLPAFDLIIKVRASNAFGTVEVNSLLFGVSNQVPGVPPQPPPVPNPSLPAIGHIFYGSANRQSLVPLRFTVSDRDMKRTNVLVEYDDGNGFQTATPSSMSDTMVGLAAPDILMDHRFIWDAKTDMGLMANEKNVTIRMTPWVGGVQGPPTTQSIRVKVEARPGLPAQETVTPMTNLTLTIEGGNNQIGAGGFLLPAKLKLKVEGPDAQGNPEAKDGIKFSFKVVAPQNLDIRLEEDDFYSTTSHYDGITAIRVRVPEVSSTQNFDVEASVIGVPNVKATFNLRIGKAEINTHASNPAEIDLGAAQVLSFFVDADQDNTTVNHLEPEPNDPLLYRVRAVNAVIDNPTPKAPEMDFSQYSSVATVLGSVRVTPIHFGTDVQLTIDVPDKPFIPAKTVNLPVRRPYNARRKLSLSSMSTSQYENVFLKCEILNGYESNNTPQRAYPGITLAKPFKVKITDQNGGEYRFKSINRAGTGCTVAPPSEKLKFEWRGTGLGVSTTPNGTPATNLVADYDQEVYVTPNGVGPWRLNVMCRPGRDRFLDIHPNSWSGTSTSGNPWCIKAWALHTATSTSSRVTVRGTFLIERAKLELTDVRTHLPAKKIRAGMRLRLRVHDLSAFVGTPSPEPISFRLEQRKNGQPPVQQGQNGAWEDNYGLFQRALDEYRSETIRIVKGTSAIPSGTNDRLHAITPCASLVARSNSFNLSIATAGPIRNRILAGESVTNQEPPEGDANTAGYQGTVLTHSGEFVKQWFDLEFLSRNSSLRVARTYRSQVASAAPEDEPLGPGWFLESHSFLTVGRFMKLWQSGRSDDLYLGHHLGRVRPKGLFFDFREDLTIDHNNSAYEIRLKEGGKIHFNTDGTLRFIEDRLRERVEYEYNERGQLFRIKDPMDPVNRWIEFEYWTDESRPEWLGKVIKAKDFDQHEVIYEYYGIAKPDGGPGWLKSVTKQPCPTMRGGDQPEMQYQRKETYIYERDPQLEWRLKKILNADGGEELVNHYSNNRIVKQQPKRNHGDTRSIDFDYSTPNETIVTDPKGRKKKFVFPQSPYWDSVLAKEVVVDFGGANLSTKTRHNHDGLLLRVYNPGGESFSYIYDHTSSRQRSRNNTLVIIHSPRLTTSVTPTRDGDRITTMVYEYDFNQVTELVTPEGNHPKSEPKMFRYRFFYDQYGNMTISRTSRHLNAYRRPNGGIRWIEETPKKTRIYSPVHKRVIKETDEMGIVTRYSYYPANDPGGENGAVPDQDGGGFLAKIEIDVEDSPERQTRFGNNIPLHTKTTRMLRNSVGDLTASVQNRGTPLEKIVHYDVNVLHENNKIAAGAGTALEIVTNEYYDANGNLALIEREQPQASNIAGGDKLIKKRSFDWQNNLAEQSTRVWDVSNNRFKWIKKTVVRHDDDQVNYVEPAYAQQFPRAVQKHEWTGNRVLKSIESGDQKIDYAHTSSGELNEITSPDGSKITYHRDKFDVPKAVVDERGSVVDTEKDETGQVVRRTVQHGHTTNNNRSYPASQSPYVELEETKFDENGNARRMYSALTLLPSTTFTPPAAGTPIGPVTDFIAHDLPSSPSIISYQDEGKVMSGTGRNLKDTLFNAWRMPTREMNAEGGYVWHRHSPHQEVIEVQSYTGNTYGQEFDVAGNQILMKEKTIYREAGSTVTHEYAQKTDFDIHGRAIRIIDNKGNANSSEFDETGFAHKVWDAMGPDSTETFNGHPVNEKGNLTEIQRDAMGNVVKTIRHLTDNGMGNGAPAVNQYNPQAKVIREYEFNTDGGPFVAFIDQAGYRSEIEYRPDGQVSKTHRWSAPGTGGTKYSTIKGYIQNTSLLDFIEDPNGSTIAFTYGRQFMEEMEGIYPANPTPNIRVENPTTYEMKYAGDGQLESIIDTVSGHTIEFERDSKGRLTRERQGAYQIKNTYEGDTRRTLHYAASSFKIDYFFDRQGRLERIDQGGRQIARFHFNGDGRLRMREHGNLRVAFESDLAGLPESLTATIGSVTIEFHIERDRLNRIEKLSRTYNGAVEETVWAYDSAGRVIKETFTAPWLTSPLETSRVFDGDDVVREENRDTWSGAQQVNNHDRGAMGRITTRNNVAQVYDNNGNLTDDGDRQYVYDPWNRLIKIEDNGQELVSYEYDGQNRLFKKAAGTNVEENVYNDWQLIEIHEANGGVTKERFIYSDQTDDLIAFEKNNHRYQVLIGPTGNVDSIFDENDQLLESYVYDLNGDFVVLDAQRQIQASPPICRILFKAKMFDWDGKIYQFRMRWYDRTRGAFLSPDPMGFTQGPNYYILASGDPVNKTDNFGTEEEESVVGAFFSGLVEGLGIGATALVNEGVKTLSFGQYEKDVIEVDPADRRIYNYAKISARIGTEAAFAAATFGIGMGAKGLQAGTTALKKAPQAIKYLAAAVESSDRVAKVVRGAHSLLRAGEGAQGVTDIYKGYKMMEKGSKMGWVLMIAGGLGVPGAANVAGAVARGAAVSASGVARLTLRAMRESSTGMHHVYRLVDSGGTTVYYGISGFPWSRNIQHGFNKSGIHHMEVLTEGMPLPAAKQLEGMLIRKHVGDFGTIRRSAPQYQQLAMSNPSLLNKNFAQHPSNWRYMDEDLMADILPEADRLTLPNPWR